MVCRSIKVVNIQKGQSNRKTYEELNGTNIPLADVLMNVELQTTTLLGRLFRTDWTEQLKLLSKCTLDLWT